MLVVIATLQGQPEKRQLIADALVKASIASRDDAGCLGYTFTADLEDPDRFVSIEYWEDQASLDAHFTQPHLAELFGAIGDALAGPPDIKTHTVA